MKNLRASLVLLLLAAPLAAQPVGPPPSDAAVPLVAGQNTPEELEQLLAPIALYPDALLALILPAATVPADIVLAARHLRDHPGDRSQIEHRAWDESVKSLTHYPEVLQWLDENLHWTKQLGEAFVRQPAEVMQAAQRLRARAVAAGTLVDTPQQRIVSEPQVVRIVPAQPDVIYVPHYEPEIVFVHRPAYYSYPRPLLTFGFGVPVGSWLAFDCDWRRNTIWVGSRHRRWTGHDWHRPVVPIAPTVIPGRIPEARAWRPSPQAARPPFSVATTFRPAITQPAPLGFSAVRPPGPRGVTPGPRGIAPDQRHPGVSPAPGVARPSRQERSYPRQHYPGSTAGAPALAEPRVTAPTPPALTPAVPRLQPLPQMRRSGDATRDVQATRDADAGRTETRSRSFRGNQVHSTPPPRVSPPPVAATAPNPPAVASTPARSFSRSAPPAASSRPQATARPAPSQPAPAPAAVESASAPAASTPPPAPRSNDVSRGHRGSERRGGFSNGR